MLVKQFIEGISGILFPHVCMICGSILSTNDNMLCSQCLAEEFETAENDGSALEWLLMPEGIAMKHALWKFDKGSKLQDLLHDLKYKHLTGVGVDLGRQLGKSLVSRKSFTSLIDGRKVRLIPVPLHPRKFRKRGYNQAFYIAKGVNEVTRLPIIPFNTVVRVKNTSSQTGFSIQKRQQNMTGAFSLVNAAEISDTVCVILDDVFTTGATAFELATLLRSGGSGDIVIATVAQA